MRLFAIALMLLFALNAIAADYAREKKWADEVVPSIVVGDPVYLGPVNGHKFLALYTEATKPKAAVMVVHGLGVHPDWNLIGVLRGGLAEQGYTTLSVQMPVLAADAATASYSSTFDEAAGRLKAAAEFLRGKGYRTIAIVSHSMGSRMSLAYLEQNPAAPVKAWVAIGMPTSGGYGKVGIPVLDLYGANDLPAVLQGAKRRAGSFRVKGSEQTAVPQTDHFFNQRDAELVGSVAAYLDKILSEQPK